jgi:hypothetical protein
MLHYPRCRHCDCSDLRILHGEYITCFGQLVLFEGKQYLIFCFTQVGIELHDPVVDGAEIFATLKNSEELIAASCQLVSDTAILSTLVTTETGQIDTDIDTLSALVTTETDQIDTDIDTLSTLVTIETDEIDGFLDDGFCREANEGNEFTSTCSLREQVSVLADEITRRFDRTDALLEAVRRLLITPQGRRPGWKSEESCQDEADCPIPPEIPAVAGGVASINFGDESEAGESIFGFHD